MPEVVATPTPVIAVEPQNDKPAIDMAQFSSPLTDMKFTGYPHNVYTDNPHPIKIMVGNKSIDAPMKIKEITQREDNAVPLPKYIRPGGQE